MIDTQKLKTQFSLDNIDLDKITQSLTEHQNFVFNAAVVGAALFIAASMFLNYRIKDGGFHSKMLQISQKLDVITSRDKAIKNLNDFKASYPQDINEDKIITQITNFATSQGVSISSLSPSDSQDMGLYDAIKVKLTGTASDYKSMVLFLRNMEKSNYYFGVNSWTGQENGNQGEILFSMEINVVRLHL